MRFAAFFYNLPLLTALLLFAATGCNLEGYHPPSKEESDGLQIVTHWPRQVATGEAKSRSQRANGLETQARGIVAIPTVTKLVIAIDFLRNHHDYGLDFIYPHFKPIRMELPIRESGRYAVTFPAEVVRALEETGTPDNGEWEIVVYVSAYVSDVGKPMFTGKSEPVNLGLSADHVVEIQMSEGANDFPPLSCIQPEKTPSFETMKGESARFTGRFSVDIEDGKPDQELFCWHLKHLNSGETYDFSGEEAALESLKAGGYQIELWIGNNNERPPECPRPRHMRATDAAHTNGAPPNRGVAYLRVHECQTDNDCALGALCETDDMGIRACAQSEPTIDGDEDFGETPEEEGFELPEFSDTREQDMSLQEADGLNLFSPCAPNPCTNPHETDCVVVGEERYRCLCEEGYQWLGERCEPCPNDSGCGFVFIEKGEFTMGSPEGEFGRTSQERAHLVSIARPFFIAQHETTQKQWRQIFGLNPNEDDDCGEVCPVVSVTWFDAAAYANRLSEKAGLMPCYSLKDCTGISGNGLNCADVEFVGMYCRGYRLPTEAEWEYAARAQTTSAIYAGSVLTRQCGYDAKLDSIGWYCNNSDGALQPVMSKAPNAFGLFDVAGNTAEWVHDAYAAYPNVRRNFGSISDPLAEERKVVRGGGYASAATECRHAARAAYAPDERHDFIGVRLVLPIVENVCEPNPCEEAHRGVCTENEQGLPLCACDLGYHLTSDGETCTDDPCDPNPCNEPERRVCTGEAGGEAQCLCNEDLQDYGDGECRTKYPCAADEECALVFRACVNEEGFAVCDDCIEGYHEESGKCVIDEVCYADSCNFKGNCHIIEGRVLCSCYPGYAGRHCEMCNTTLGYHRSADGVTCTTEPCDPNPCNEPHKSRCEGNPFGNAVCSCDEGYRQYGSDACRPQDPCSLHDPCEDLGRHCVNELGISTCAECFDGLHFSANGQSCTNNPCDPNPCDEPNKGVCEVDENDEAICLCDAGYHDYGDGECRPQDPCEGDIECAALQRECLNNLGVATCGDCLPGLHFSSDNRTCTDNLCDPNPCNDENHEICNEGVCECDVENGYHRGADEYTCTNFLCEPNPCTGTHQVGCLARFAESFECVCENGYRWDGEACLPCEDGQCGQLGDTGQANCYGVESPWGKLDCPSSPESNQCAWTGGCGQDAQYEGNPPARKLLANLGEEVVFDTNTNLYWQRRLSESLFTHEEAVAYCETLDYAGLNDWRLPLEYELLSIVDFDRINPAVDTMVFAGTPNATFHAASYVANSNKTQSWALSSAQGKIEQIDVQSLGLARCVRGETWIWPAENGRFMRRYGTVLDTKTKLEWEWSRSYSMLTTWRTALTLCENLDAHGHDDWRLPNVMELYSLIDSTRVSPASFDEFFDNVPSDWFWTSTSTAPLGKEAWSVNFNRGEAATHLKTYPFNIRCVRDWNEGEE